MQVEIRRSGPVDVLEVRGRMVGDSGARQLRDKVDELLSDGDPVFVVDLSGLTQMDSASLGELVACREHVRKRSGVMKLVLTGRPYDLFMTTRLDYLFEIFPDVGQALASFDPDTMTAGIP